MPQHSVIQDLWDTVRRELESLFPRDVFETWFLPLEQLELKNDILALSVPNDFSAIWIEDNYIDLITRKVEECAGHPIEVKVKVVSDNSADAGSTLLGATETSTSRIKTAEQARDEVKPLASAARKKQILLNPRNTFEHFVIGPSNQLAHAASVAMAKEPAKAYNPLFIYGDTGLGKTHLMHASAHYILDRNPDAKVVYVSCEKFTNEFIRAIQENTLVNFRKYYRSIDVLFIDDIHFLAGKERIQEEIFHTFNELFESQRQICLASDRPAGEIAKLESRLVSRFQWGMVTDLQAPDLETRVAILAKKASVLGKVLPADILEFLAQNITKNVRRMEGALTRVVSYVNLTGQPLNITTTEKLLRDILQEEAQNQITIEKIQKKVVDHFKLRPSDMVSKRRPHNIAFPRQVAMYLSRLLTNHCLAEIGEAFGGRDHGTVIHACKTVENEMDQDDSVKRKIDYLIGQLSNQNP